MSELLKINVNEHVEKKNGLSYLSWAWAWAEVLKVDPLADWEHVEYPQPDGTLSPCCYVGNGTALVKTKVTIKGKTRCCQLPVMNNRNQAIKDPDAFAINTAIVRCLTKTISMHGLGLYIYAGEDLPEGEEPEQPQRNVVPASFRSSPTMTADGRRAIEELPADQQQYLRELAQELTEMLPQGGPALAARLHKEHLDNEQKLGIWSILDSKVRSAIKAGEQAVRAAA